MKAKAKTTRVTRRNLFSELSEGMTALAKARPGKHNPVASVKTRHESGARREVHLVNVGYVDYENIAATERRPTQIFGGLANC